MTKNERKEMYKFVSYICSGCGDTFDNRDDESVNDCPKCGSIAFEVFGAGTSLVYRGNVVDHINGMYFWNTSMTARKDDIKMLIDMELDKGE